MLEKFFYEMTEGQYNLDEKFYECQLSYIKEGVSIPYPTLRDELIPVKFMDDSIDKLKSLVLGSSELDEFFSKIYVSDEITSVPLTIPIMDVGEIKAIKPQYLTQFIENASTLIGEAMNKKIDINTITKKLDNIYVNNLKKQIVDSSLPDYIKDKDLVGFDKKSIISVTPTYITMTILPFLRSLNHQLKVFTKESSMIKETVSNNIVTLQEYLNTCNRLNQENNKNVKTVNALVQTLIATFMKACKYMIACFIRKVTIYIYNLQEYYKVRDTLLRYFPGGENTFLHESVLDGKDTFRDEDIVHSLINGNADFLTSVNDRLYRTFYDYLEEEKRESDEEIVIEDIPYDETSYKKILVMFHTILKELQTFSEQLKDPDTPIQDIQSKSGFDITFTDQFSDIIYSINDLDYYTSYEDATRYDIYCSILNELDSTKGELVKYGEIAKSLFDFLTKIKNDIRDNVNDMYENHERNKETLFLIDDIDKNYRQFLLMMGRALLSRYKNIEDQLTKEKSEVGFDSLTLDFEDYVNEAYKMEIDLQEDLFKDKLNQFYESFLSIMNDKTMQSIYMEAEAQAQPQQGQQQQAGQQGNQNAQANNGGSTTKVTIQDNNTETQSSASGGGAKINTDFVTKLIEKIRAFNKSVLDKILKAMNTTKGNVDWLKNNKDGLLKRSYTNVSVNILPYDDSIDPLSQMDAVLNNVKSLQKKVVTTTKNEDIEALVFKGMNLKGVPTNTKDAGLSERLSQYLKINTNKLEAVQVKDGDLGGRIPKMIGYCEKYYGSFSKELESKAKEVETSVDQFTKNMLAEGDAGQPPEGSSLQQNVTTICNYVNILTGACINAAKDKANDYMTVLNALAPKVKPAEQNTQNNQEEQNAETNNGAEQQA